MKLRSFLRPICWFKGHNGALIHSIGFVSAEASYPAKTYCARCLKSPVQLSHWEGRRAA